VIPPILGVTAFDGLGWAPLAGLALVYFAAFFVKGLFGYGAVSALVVGASFFVSPHHAVLLAALSNTFTQIQLMPQGWREGDRAIAGRLAFWAVPSIVLGVWIFANSGETGLGLMIGFTILALVGLEMTGALARIEPFIARHAAVLGPALSAFSGMLAGMVGAGGVILLSIYIRLLCPEKRLFRGTVLMVATVFVLWRALVLAVGGMIGWDLLYEALLLAPVAWAGSKAGTSFMRGMPDPVFFRAYQGVLVLASALMIWQSLPA
jgi:uncharacterized protein